MMFDDDYCYGCPFYGKKDTVCRLNNEHVNSNDPCNFVSGHYSFNYSILEKIMHHNQKYRRGNAKMISPILIGKANDEIIRILRKLKNNEKNNVQ